MVTDRKTPAPSSHSAGSPGDEITQTTFLQWYRKFVQEERERVDNSYWAVQKAFLAGISHRHILDLRGIETAPKDGTWFIAYQDGEPFPCDWRSEEQDDGPPREGWFDFFNRSFEEPTHWTPVMGATPETLNTPSPQPREAVE